MYGNGFFDQGVETCFECGDPEFGVGVVGCRDKNGIDRARLNQFKAITKMCRVCKRSQPLYILIGDGDEGQSWDCPCGNTLGKALPPATQTYNSETNCLCIIHERILLISAGFFNGLMKQIIALLKHSMRYPNLYDEAIDIVALPFINEQSGVWEWRSTTAGHWNLWICLEGEAVIECDGQEYAVQPWTAFLFSDDSEIAGRSKEGSKQIRNFSIHLRLGAGNAKLLRRRLLGIQLHEADAANSLINLATRLAAYRDTFARKQLQILTLNMLGLLWRESIQPVQTDAAWLIYRQLDRIHAGQGMFRSVEELAMEANLSRIHYGRCFRQLTGESPNRYLILKRVKRACVLLAQTDWSIDAIARSIGYADIYFFSRQFREVMNCSPSEFKKQQALDLKRYN